MYPKTLLKMEELVKSGQLPGVSYGFISQDKKEIGYLGYKQLTPKAVKLTPGTLYDMASLTKVICTTTIILKLVEAGQVDINQALAIYLPEFEDKKVTIKELLTHTSDINPYIPNRNELNQEELIQALLKLTSGDSRGKKTVYTDTGTVLLGLMIEKIYGKSVHAVFMEEVIQPLGMLSSGFNKLPLENVAPTEYSALRGLIQGEVHDPKAYVLKEHCGSAGLFSTVEDTMLFVDMMMNDGKVKEKQFLKADTIQSLLTNYAPHSDKARSLGWDLIHESRGPILYHTGYTGTFLLIDILTSEAFIFLSNRVHPVDNRKEYLAVRDELISIYLKERQAI